MTIIVLSIFQCYFYNIYENHNPERMYHYNMQSIDANARLKPRELSDASAEAREHRDSFLKWDDVNFKLKRLIKVVFQ